MYCELILTNIYVCNYNPGFGHFYRASSSVFLAMSFYFVEILNIMTKTLGRNHILVIYFGLKILISVFIIFIPLLNNAALNSMCKSQIWTIGSQKDYYKYSATFLKVQNFHILHHGGKDCLFTFGLTLFGLKKHFIISFRFYWEFSQQITFLFSVMFFGRQAAFLMFVHLINTEVSIMRIRSLFTTNT